MFQLGKTIVSEEIIQNEFVCNLSACKGACCVDGDAGAPLEEEELMHLKFCQKLINRSLLSAFSFWDPMTDNIVNQN